LNYFKRIRSFRLICYVLAFLIGTPTLTLIAPVPAAAQAPDLVEVAVVDFINRTGVGGDYIGKLASDALVVELKRSDRFDVSTRASVQAGMDEMGFRAPLSHTQLMRLGQTVLKGDVGQTSAMIEGDVTSLKVKGNPRTAEVEMIVRMVDVASGEFINGAVTTGVSRLRIGDNPDDDRLVEEAVNDAAYKAVKTMVDYIIPEATVMNTMGTNEVLLNKGAREGIKRGMKMIVFRRGELVGKVQVGDVTPNDATASVIYAPKGVKPEDKVRAVFDVPEFHGKGDQGVEEPAPKAARAPKSGRSGISHGGSGLLKGLVLLAGLAFLFKGGSGTAPVGAVTARAGLAPDIPATEGGVKITWDVAKLGGGRNILEYHIWRDNEPTPVGAVVPAGLSFFIDDVGPGTRAVSYQVIDPIAHTKTAATAAVNRPATGVPHQYFVSAVYQIEEPAGSGTFKYFETDKAATGLATITRRMLAGPTGDLLGPTPDQLDVNLVTGETFQFNSRRGGDTYIIQISTSVIFSAPQYTSPIIQFNPAVEGVVSFPTGNISSSFGAVTAGTQMYWRVGVRNSQDRPGPVPNMGKASMTFLFSEPSSFFVAEIPPPPP
jgi:hypothetical protein